MSKACGERVLFPAVRGASPDDLVVAPGFSCRHQIADFCDGRRSVFRWVLLAAVVAAGACSSSEAPPDAGSAPADSGREARPGFGTSRLHYDARRVADGIEISIPYFYRNVTGDSVYFANCNEIIVPSLEKQTGDTWSSVWTGASPACRSLPVVVPPGGERRDTIQVLSAPGMYPEFREDDIDGTYRLVWHGVFYHGEPPVGTPLPQDGRTSNEFTLSASKQ